MGSSPTGDRRRPLQGMERERLPWQPGDDATKGTPHPAQPRRGAALDAGRQSLLRGVVQQLLVLKGTEPIDSVL